MYNLPVHLYEKFIRNRYFRNAVLMCWQDGVSYNEMLENVLCFQTERAEDLERKLVNAKKYENVIGKLNT